jgi:biopolymer transport protein ExbB/TolQ
MSDIIAIIIKGGLVMIPLLLCSVIALAVTIERFFYWRQISSKKPLEQMLLTELSQVIAKKANFSTTPLRNPA